MSRGAFPKINGGLWLKLYGLVSFEHWIQLCLCWEVIIDSSDSCGTSTLVTYYLNFIARQDIYAQSAWSVGRLDIGVLFGRQTRTAQHVTHKINDVMNVCVVVYILKLLKSRQDHRKLEHVDVGFVWNDAVRTYAWVGTVDNWQGSPMWCVWKPWHWNGRIVYPHCRIIYRNLKLGGI